MNPELISYKKINNLDLKTIEKTFTNNDPDFSI